LLLLSLINFFKKILLYKLGLDKFNIIITMINSIIFIIIKSINIKIIIICVINTNIFIIIKSINIKKYYYYYYYY
jgi:hypothetical protein